MATYGTCYGRGLKRWSLDLTHLHINAALSQVDLGAQRHQMPPAKYRSAVLERIITPEVQGLVLGIEYRQLRLDSCSRTAVIHVMAAGNEMVRRLFSDSVVSQIMSAS
jgi:hypothetical protein